MYKDIDSHQRDSRADGHQDGFKKNPNFRFFKKKTCRFCDMDRVPDYKEFDFLKKFITEQGKILPRRITGTSAKHQRRLALEVKKARYMALLPFVKKY
ncbi:30S ribosomal protein S18 [Borrelia puertoricensis]|uniref:30S ribosomal protein S18 n=1 Tax=Borrelia puertoricensis TaxID=2756107 RepID=UPI003EBC2655